MPSAWTVLKTAWQQFHWVTGKHSQPHAQHMYDHVLNLRSLLTRKADLRKAEEELGMGGSNTWVSGECKLFTRWRAESFENLIITFWIICTCFMLSQGKATKNWRKGCSGYYLFKPGPFMNCNKFLFQVATQLGVWNMLYTNPLNTHYTCNYVYRLYIWISGWIYVITWKCYVKMQWRNTRSEKKCAWLKGPGMKTYSWRSTIFKREFLTRPLPSNDTPYIWRYLDMFKKGPWCANIDIPETLMGSPIFKHGLWRSPGV